ncbi:unnamed protein product, partial [Polarella glacialis]
TECTASGKLDWAKAALGRWLVRVLLLFWALLNALCTQLADDTRSDDNENKNSNNNNNDNNTSKNNTINNNNNINNTDDLAIFLLRSPGNACLAGLLLAACAAAVAAFLGSSKVRQKLGLLHRQSWQALASSFFCTWGLLWLTLRQHGALEAWLERHQLPFRVLVVALAFYWACYLDVLWRTPEMTHAEFGRHFVVAAGQALSLLPLVTMVVAAVFLALLTLP